MLDSVRRIVRRWTQTETPISADIDIGDTELTVVTNRRFKVGDEVMLRDASVGEVGLVVAEIDVDDHTRLVLDSPGPLNTWTMTQNTLLTKLTHGMHIEGIYIGDPDVIPQYPAITVNGISRHSDWLTLDSTKERYEVEITVFVLESTHEKGYRFLLKLTDMIQIGLKRNIFPLIDDYNTTTLQTGADVVAGDLAIRVNDATLFGTDFRIMLENEWFDQENKVARVTPDVGSGTAGTIELYSKVGDNFDVDSTTIIQPNRFAYNSWPEDIEYGYVHKGDLLKAAKIRWFCEEEEIQTFRKLDTKLV